jgi:hypothetical protein
MYIANCGLNLGSGPVVEGDVIEAAGANFGPWVGLGKITQLSDRAVANILRAAMPGLCEIGEGFTIKGSDLHPALIAWEDEDVPLTEMVGGAFGRSGLSPVAWNALPSATRDTLIWAEFQLSGEPTPALEAADSVEGPAPDAPPLGEYFTFDPALHGLKYRGKVGGHWITGHDRSVNILKVEKETYGRLKVAEKAGKVAYVVAADIVEGNAGGDTHTKHDGAYTASTGGEAAHA